jgi:hypothetical protein
MGRSEILVFGARWLVVLPMLVTLGSAPARAADAEFATSRMPAVIPQELRGDLRDLPLVYAPPPPYRAHPRAAPPTATVSGSEPERAPSAPGPSRDPMPAPTQDFAGLNFSDTCGGVQCGGGWPPMANGAVGRDHYIQAVNSAYAIYSKTGTLLASFTQNQFFAAAGENPCNGSSGGDAVVLYDQIADRFILTNRAGGTDAGGFPIPPFFQCIAASKTSDPVSGGWWLFALRMDPGATGLPPVGALNDYAKFGLWTDCLYMGANEFFMPGGTPTGVFIGHAVAAFNRADLYNGTPLTWSLGFSSGGNPRFLPVPANMSGIRSQALPPPGTPNYFVSQGPSSFRVRTFAAGPNCGGATVGPPVNVSQAGYTVPAGNVVPQPGTTNLLDALDDRVMQKVQYRRVGATESLWIVHNAQTTVGPDTTVKPQWAQIDVTGGAIGATPVQQEIFTPDTTLNRWMGSLAVDHEGNMALGYSTSNGVAPNFPSIAYAGRLASDPLNTLPQSETELIAGAGSQTHQCGGGPCHLWGDYSGMSIDPADDCTFWYTNQYYESPANGASGNWQTRIGAFKFPSCTPVSLPTFDDVPDTHPFFDWIEALVDAGITAGCSTNPPLFCPGAGVTRGAMAVFILRGIHGAGYDPPAATGTMFADVPASHPFAKWIEQLAREGITGGCATNPARYCPDATVTRAEMAVFLLRAEHGAGYDPPAATGGTFADVPASHPLAAWIEQLAREGITAGCATNPSRYCPDAGVTRGEMAVFLVRIFNLPI